MRKKSGLFLILFIFYGGSFAQDVEHHNYNQLHFAQEVYDFGILTSDSSVSHVFHFKNMGADTIQIYNVGSS